MDHIVYLNTAAEISQLLSGEKTLLARASMGKKRPYGRVAEGDSLFFLNGFNPKVKAMAMVKSAVSAESRELAPDIRKSYGKILAPAPQRELLNRRYVILIELEKARPIVPFSLSDNIHGSPGDWVVVENIDEAIS
ncbi:MAG TPA: hypothetical protein VMC84_09930 [Methanocella sp.]|uniref:hypothetical protein n=1 Tax=Methanocella sp. TaxID=2052833 RepID=UPI002C763B07|nr:hypothetical protein [Methanocella sp.]HTY91483.1 hypothetical protein [Methanocella sp.]